MEKSFEIDSNIYSSSSIKQAISDFEDIALLSFKWWKLSISWEDDSSVQEVFNEFMNYVIWLSVE